MKKLLALSKNQEDLSLVKTENRVTEKSSSLNQTRAAQTRVPLARQECKLGQEAIMAQSSLDFHKIQVKERK